MRVLCYVILMSGCYSFAATCNAQTGQYLNSEYYSNYIPKRAESSSLGSFGNIPINYYSGLPEISFELMRLKGRAMDLPVTINYDASGVKTDELSGETGLKWTLAAGGYVARQMNG